MASRAVLLKYSRKSVRWTVLVCRSCLMHGSSEGTEFLSLYLRAGRQFELGTEGVDAEARSALAFSACGSATVTSAPALRDEVLLGRVVSFGLNEIEK